MAPLVPSAGSEAITYADPVEAITYSLGIRALAEFIGMAMVIYTGESALANELLPSTKGHGMGWGWAVWTFGFAFLPPLQVVQLISAKLNPALCLAQAIFGNITWVDFVVLSAAEVAGVFFGAVLHWLHFYPHWRTLPEPPPEHSSERLLRRRDVASDDALRFAGYSTAHDRVMRPRNPLADLRYRLRGAMAAVPEEAERSAGEILSEYFHERDPVTRSASVTRPPSAHGDKPLARRTLQLPPTRPSMAAPDLQRHLAAKHVEGVLRRRTCPTCSDARAAAGAAAGAGGDEGGARDQGADVAIAMGGAPPSKNEDEEHKRALALYEAALVAERNLKLSIFATRPAINAPLFNLLTETMGTAALILIALLIELQARRLPLALRPVYVVGLQPLLITFSIVMLISGLEGLTTYAANPARDFGPRLAYWLLPIPNKGHAEWVYSWIPIVGPLLGGAIAGGLYIALEEMSFPGNGVLA